MYCWCLHWMQSINWTASGLWEHTQCDQPIAFHFAWNITLIHKYSVLLFTAWIVCSLVNLMATALFVNDLLLRDNINGYSKTMANTNKTTTTTTKKKRILNLVHRSNNGWRSEWFFLDWLKAPLREINDGRWCNCCGNLLMIWQIETRAVKLLPIDWIAIDAGAMLL